MSRRFPSSTQAPGHEAPHAGLLMAMALASMALAMSGVALALPISSGSSAPTLAAPPSVSPAPAS